MGKGRRTHSHRKKDKSRILTKKISWSLQGVLIGILLSVVLAWVFYDSIFGMLIAVVMIPVTCMYLQKRAEEKRMEHNKVAFKEMLLLLSSYMQAGYSIENAFREVEMELRQLFTEDDEIVTLVHTLNEKIRMNIPVETAFYEEIVATLSIEEALEFADVLFYAKRLGGNYIANMQKAAAKIEDKLGIQDEITTIMTEKQLELRIMTVMPLGILAYIKLTSDSFISALYHNTFGVIFMSGCIVVYGVMIWLGRKIIKIEV